jgi:prepilin-type N-terminal cleavage/methylation domain-containing protein
MRHMRAACRREDCGFTLVEVILAMVLVLIVMASLIGVLLSSLTTVTQARQRQTATALATQALERLRALPYDEVTQPNGGSIDAGLTDVVASGSGYLFQPAALTGVNEPLVVNDWSGQWEDQVVDGVTYRIQTYVTQPPATAAGQQTFNLTALVSWSSNVSNGTRTTAQRSVTYSPAGCLSTSQSPFAAPCQAYFTAHAGGTAGGVEVTNFTSTGDPIEGFGSSAELSMSLATMSSTLLLEQTATTSSSARTTAAASDSAESGGALANVIVDSDPSSPEGQSEDETISGHTSTALTTTGPAGRLSMRPFTSDTGGAAAAILAGSTTCMGSNGVGLLTGPAAALRPCGAAEVRPSGTPAQLVWSTPSSTIDVPVVTVNSSGTMWRSVAANLTNSNASACTTGAGPTALGCSHASTARSFGDVLVGARGSAAGSAPAGWTRPSVIQVVGLQETARAEEGTGSGTPSYTRSGSLWYWDGTAHVEVPLSAGTAGTFTIPETTFEYADAGGPVYVTYQGTVLVQPTTSERLPATRTGDPLVDCKADACTTRVNGGSGLVANLVVTVTSVPYDPAATPLGEFSLGVDLGGLVAQASYKAAPNA